MKRNHIPAIHTKIYKDCTVFGSIIWLTKANYGMNYMYSIDQ